MSDAVVRLGRRWPGRRAIITGAASGLGRELARSLARGGWRLGLLDLDSDRLAGAAEEMRRLGAPAVRAEIVDVRDWPGMERAYEAVAEAFGGLDLAVQNAGVGVGGSFLDTPVADWDWVLGINLMGVVHGCRAALPILRRSGGGHIHNVASAAAFGAAPGMTAYNTAKAGVLALSETLHGELLDDPGLSISVAMPYFFRTGLIDGLRAPAEERHGAALLMDHSGLTVEGVAADILRSIAAGKFYILCPERQIGFAWRFKRFLPMTYLRKVPALRQKRIAALQAGAGAGEQGGTGGRRAGGARSGRGSE